MDKAELLREIDSKIDELKNHEIYGAINSLERLTLFMERHVYAVFDFMSLTKSLQQEFAPAQNVWHPPRDNSLARFINEIVLCEESDETFDGKVMSHFEMYCMAMAEVKANSDHPQKFVQLVRESGIDQTVAAFEVPASSKEFMLHTFDIVKNKEIHQIAASFCFGREKVIPHMFQALLDKMDISEEKAPYFHFYLKRHIEVDGDSHGPMAIKMLEILCEDDLNKWEEAKEAALTSLDARIKLWDDVLEEILCS